MHDFGDALRFQEHELVKVIRDLKDLTSHVVNLHDDGVRHLIRVLLNQNGRPLSNPGRYCGMPCDVAHEFLHLLIVQVKPLVVHGAAALWSLLCRHVKVHAQMLLPHSTILAIGLLCMEDRLFSLNLRLFVLSVRDLNVCQRASESPSTWVKLQIGMLLV